MATPGAARGVPEGRLEPVGLRDEDGGRPERAAQLADQSQLDAEPADGKPERDPVRRSDDATRRWCLVGGVASGKNWPGFELSTAIFR